MSSLGLALTLVGIKSKEFRLQVPRRGTHCAVGHCKYLSQQETGQPGSLKTVDPKLCLGDLALVIAGLGTGEEELQERVH